MILGDMEVRLRADYARLQRDMDQMRQVVSSTMADIDKYVGYAKKAFIAFFGVASVNAFAGMVKGSIDAAAGLHDMSIQTGASVAGLMALRSVAATSDTTIQDITGSMNKMAKNMAVANEESKGTGQAIKALGLDFNTLKGLAPDRQMLEVAKALDKFQDGAGKSAVAMSLYGKEGAKMLPFLKDLADESDAVTAKLSEQQVVAKAAQAAMADDFSDNLTKIKKAGEAWKKDLSMGMLPALYEASQAFINVTGGAGGFKEMISKLAADGSITRWARMAVTGLTYLMDALQIAGRVAEAVGKGIGAQLSASINMVSGMSSAMMKFAKGDWSDAWGEVKSTVSATANISKNFMSDVGDIFGERTFGSKMRDSLKALQGVGAAAKETKAALNFEANPEKDKAAQKEAAAREAAANKEAAAYLGVAVALKEKIAGYQVEIDGGKQLTEMQKARIKFDQELAEGKVVLSEAHVVEIRQMLDSAAAQERYIAYGKAYTTQMKARTDAQDEAYRAAVKEAEANEALVATFGMSKKAIESEGLARLENQLAQKATLGLMASEIAELERLIEVKKRNSAAVSTLDDLETRRDADKKMSDDMLAEQKKSVDKYNDIFSKGFADMLNNGKAGWKSFTTSLVTTFKTSVADQIYKMFAQPFVVKMVASLVGTMSGTAMAQDGTSSAGQIGSLLQTGKNLYESISNGFTGLATSLGGVVSTVGNFFGSASVSGFGAGMGLTGGQAAAAAQAYTSAGMAGTGSAISAGAATGAAVTAAAGIAAGVLGGRMISGGYSAFGGSGNSAVNTGTAVGAVVGSIVPVIGTAVGALIGGLIGGATNRLFGHKPKEYTSQNIVGTLDSSGFSGDTVSNWIQKGGIFRSDKKGIEVQSIDQGQAKVFADTYDQLKALSGGFAKTLGADVRSLAERSQAVTIAVTKDQAANEKAIADFFTGVADTIARELVPGLEKFQAEGESSSAALQRLAGNYQAIEAVLTTLGRSSQEAFGAIGLASIDARERLITAAGGIEALVNGTAYFAQNFMTPAEQMAPIIANVEKQLADLGFANVKTAEDFKKATLAIDLSGQAGADLYAKMLQLAPQVKQVTDYTGALAAATAQQADVLAQAKAQAAAELAAVNAPYEQQIAALLKARMSEAEVIELETHGMDASTLVLFKRIKALEAEDAATAAATAAIEKAAQAAKDSVTKLEADLARIAGAREGLAEQMFTALLGGKDLQGKIDQIKGAEAAAWSKVGTGADSVASLEKIRTLAMQRIELEGQLQEQSVTDLRAQYSLREQSLTSELGAMVKMRDYAQQLLGFTGSLKLGELSALGPTEKLAEAERQYRTMLDRARGGDEGARGGLQDIAQTYLQLQKQFSGSTQGYVSTYASVIESLETLAASAPTDPQIEAQKLQISTIQSTSAALSTTVRDTSAKQVEELKRIGEALAKAETNAEAQLVQAGAASGALVKQLEKSNSKLADIGDRLARMEAKA